MVSGNRNILYHRESLVENGDQGCAWDFCYAKNIKSSDYFRHFSKFKPFLAKNAAVFCLWKPPETRAAY